MADRLKAGQTRLTPEQRVMRARIAAATMHARGLTNTAPALNKSPASLEWHAEQLDPKHELPQHERIRRAEHAKTAYFQRLAFRSSVARRRARELAADAAAAEAELAALADAGNEPAPAA